MRANLKETIGWKGQTYSGECDIPDELAMVLGIKEEESETPALPPESLVTETEAPIQPITEKPKRTRKR